MNATGLLSEFNHPAIIAKANELTEGKLNRLEKIEAIFYFMRDGIKFSFPSTWDVMKASEALECGYGYCNTKASLFVALCKSADIPARLHIGLIDANIMRGIFPWFAFPFLPNAASHSWIDVEIDCEWKQIDSYINDKALYEKALEQLMKSKKNLWVFSRIQRW